MAIVAFGYNSKILRKKSSFANVVWKNKFLNKFHHGV